jgi:hypothetical protein
MTDDEVLALLGEEERQEWLALSEEEKAGVRDSFTPGHIPPTDELRGLTRQLFARARAGQGRILRREAFEGARINECIDNATAWVEAHPGTALVFGFLLNDFGYRLGHVRFTPHVAVKTERGDWLDVTPHNAFYDHLFLQHAGTDEEFFAAFEHGPMDLIYRAR